MLGSEELEIETLLSTVKATTSLVHSSDKCLLTASNILDPEFTISFNPTNLRGANKTFYIDLINKEISLKN